MATLTLLERDRELKAIGRALDGAAEGSGRLLVLEGEAGIGKTALLGYAAGEAERRGFRVQRARAGALERSLGFGVASQLFEADVVQATAAARRSFLAGSAALAGPLFGIDPPRPGASAGGDFHLQHGLYWLVANLADRGPVALLIDDVHWSDDATLRWLVYLARRMESLPLLVASAVRTGEPDAPADLLAELGAAAMAETLRPRPLGASATAELVQSAYAEGVEPEFGSACHEWTGGNPMFAGELASELAAEGVAPLAASVPRMRRLTPPSIARVTLLRLARLPEPAVALARAAAIVGTGSELRYAAALAELDDATEAADALVAAHFLDSGDPLRFRHPLVASVVYDDMAPGRRAAAHARAARLLADGGADPGRVAAQLLRAAPEGDAWAVEALIGGARRELSRGSAPTAVALLRRAREEPPGRDALPRLLHELGLAESLAGDRAAADTLRAALEASTDPEERGWIALLLGRLFVRAGRTGDAVAAVEPAIDGLDSAAPDLRLQLEATLLTAAALDVRLVELAIRRIGGVAEAALASDSHGARLIAAQLAWAATATGASVQTSIDLARRALGNGQLVREAPITPDAYLLPILMLALCDELEEADRYCEQALALAREGGAAPAYAGTAAFRAGVAYLRGRLDEAELLALDAIRLADEAHGLVLVRGLTRAYLAGILTEKGDPAGALEALGDLSDLEESPMAWSAELLFAGGRAHVAERRLDEGLALLLACGRRCDEWRVPNPAWLPWRSHAALVLHGLGDQDRALQLSEEELWRARRFGARRPLGIALRARGLIEGGDEGIELLRESVAVLSESPARLEHARALVALGGALRRSRRRADARAPLSEGLELAERCGAGPLIEEARAELRACGARPRSVMRTGTDALTASERRVCEMAAAGMSNPEIAQALFVTRATVESHLHSAYRKLDLTSRRQLADALDVSQ